MKKMLLTILIYILVILHPPGLELSSEWVDNLENIYLDKELDSIQEYSFPIEGNDLSSLIKTIDQQELSSKMVKELGKGQAKKRIALTFDACETTVPSYFDQKILSYLVNHKIPFTVFVSGRFLERNQKSIQELSKLPYVEIENHSYSHSILKGKSKEFIMNDIIKNSKLIQEITGVKPKYFRFPAGIYDRNSLNIVNSLGLKVVHWSYESGDPDKRVTSQKLIKWILLKTKDKDILIFHINGRGWSTGEALPRIIEELNKRNYSYQLLKDMPVIRYIE